MELMAEFCHQREQLNPLQKRYQYDLNLLLQVLQYSRHEKREQVQHLCLRDQQYVALFLLQCFQRCRIQQRV